MWHSDHISEGTKYDKFENLTKLTGGECRFAAQDTTGAKFKCWK